jgi:hypothetical protein
VSPPKSLSAYMRPPILEATSLIVALAAYLAAVALLLSNVSKLSGQLRYLEYGITLLCILLPLPILAGFRWISPKTRWTLQRATSNRDTVRGFARPDYFRLSPYERNDIDSFHRMDDEHVKTLEWIRESDSPLLYLSGLSGTGKSSLLRAYVLPRLCSAPWNFRVIEIQSSNDPIQELTNIVSAQKRLLAEDNTPQSTAGAYLKVLNRKGNTLILFDQFERFLVSGKEHFERFGKFFEEVSAYGNVKILIVVRSDYISLINEIKIPMPTLGSNWKEVGLFTDHAARAFFEEAGIGLDDRLIGALLEGASKLEGNVGLYRPITLNMIGILVDRFGKNLPPKFEPAEFIQTYLREAILEANVGGVAPTLIRRMVTRRGTTSGINIDEMAEEIGRPSHSIRECLFRLQAKGLVRSLDDKGSNWEMSHDFVAQELRAVVGRIGPSLITVLFPVGVAMAFLLWSVVVVIAPKYFDILSQAVAEAKFGGEGYLSEHQEVIRADALAMAADLNREGSAVIGEPQAFQQLLDSQAALRALTEAIVFLRDGQAVARSGLSHMLDLERVPPTVLEQATDGEVVVMTGDADDRVRALIRLQDVNDAFLFVGRYVNPEMVRLTDADDRYRAVDALKENWNYIYYTATALYLVAVMLQVWAFFRLRDYKV